MSEGEAEEGVLVLPAVILVVDDDDGVRESLEDALEASGYPVRAEASGHAAIAAIREERPAVVVTDIHMPGGDGFDVLEHARSLSMGPAVVVLSAGNDPDDRRRAEELGAVAYIPKPFEVARLLAIVRRYQ